MKRSLFTTLRAALGTPAGAARPSKPRNRRLPLAVEEMEARLVMTTNLSSLYAISYLPPAPTAAGNALINGLWDPALRSTASVDYNRDGQLTRNDMIQLFKQATNNYTFCWYTDAHDLQTLVNNSTTVAMPGYVQNLSSKVLNSSAASAYYYSGLLYGTQPIYNIVAAQGIGVQVNNFFLGQYRPTPSVTIGTSSGSATYTGTYQQVSGTPLFSSGGPKYTDVAQGVDGDCWLMASLAEVAYQNPGVIQNMFIDNGDGTYTVRFYNNGTADYVTVDNYLPNSGNLFAHPQGNLWVALAEKAYAEECGYGWIGTGTPNSSSYQALNNGYAVWALSAITGSTSTSTTNIYNVYIPYYGYISNTGTIASSWLNGQYVVLNTTSGGASVVPSHCYAMVGYNWASGQFTFFNPWGTGGGTSAATGVSYPGYFTGNGASVAANFSSWSQTNSGALIGMASPIVSAVPPTHSTSAAGATSACDQAISKDASTGHTGDSAEATAMLASLSRSILRTSSDHLRVMDSVFALSCPEGDLSTLPLKL